MAASLLNPLTCGYAKKAVAFEIMSKSPAIKKDSREGGNKYKTKASTLQYQAFNDTFRDRADQFKLSYKDFIKKAPKLKEIFKNWNRHKPKEKPAMFTLLTLKMAAAVRSKKTAAFNGTVQGLPPLFH